MFAIEQGEMASAISSFQIPVKPQILTQLQLFVEEPNPDLEALAHLISLDIGLSSRILKIINSPSIGMNRTVSEIKQAVMLLGVNSVHCLVSALLLEEHLSKDDTSLELFWADAQNVANAISYIGSKIKSKIPVEMLYTLGLFHDCGIPLMIKKYPDYREFLLNGDMKGNIRLQIEDERFQTNHAVVGYFVVTSWHLPKDICDLVLRHHDVDYLRNITGSTSQLAYAALKASENLVERKYRLKPLPDWKVLEEPVLDVLGITRFDYEDMIDDF